MKSVIFIAPPAAGKGTQSSFLKSLGYEHLSTGDMLRSEISSGSELGKNINELISNGLLVSDEIVINLIESRLNSLKGKPFILDGFPRTINQVVSLDNILTKLNVTDYVAIYLDLDMDTALKRALGRLTCSCGMSYNSYFDELKPKTEGICDKCRGKLVKRNDDNEESFKQRFATYLENTTPIINFYEQKKVLVKIDASRDSKSISNDIKDIVK